MKRREFITLLGGAAAAWPSWRARSSAMPVIGFLYAEFARDKRIYRGGISQRAERSRLRRGPRTWRSNTVGRKVRYARLPELAADLVRREWQSSPRRAAAQRHSRPKPRPRQFPSFRHAALDPVQSGLVASFNRPGGNVTGVSYMSAELGAKQLGLLHEILPGATRFAVLVNPNDPTAESTIRDLQAAASAIGRQIEVFTPAPIATSIRPLRASCKSGPTRSWLVPTRYLVATAYKSPRWRPATRSPRSIPIASMLQPAD